MAGSETWLDRPKYRSLDEHLSEYAANNRRLGRRWCPVIEWMQGQPNETLDDVIAAETYIQGHPEWGPGYCCDVIRDSWRFNSPPDAERIQHDHALALARHPWDRIRPHVERLLAHGEVGWQSREALRLIVDCLAAKHPNPKAFLAQPPVRARLPVWLNLSELPCPDRPDLAHEPMTGLGRFLPL